jgi:4-amino-4-deoxychorismate lyase
MDKWLVDGEQSTTLAISDRGLAYGDGLFETIAIRNGACRFMHAHIERLQRGCERLAIPAPDPAQLQREAAALITATNCAHGTLKIIITRGSGPRGYAFAAAAVVPSRIVGISVGTRDAVHDGVRIRFCDTPVSRNPALAGIKSLNRLAQVMARAEWHEPNIAEGLMTDDRGNLIGGTMTNLFIVRNGNLRTPPVTDCGIAGIMRSKVIASATQLGLNVDEMYFSRRELENATEIFLTNCLIGLWPVHAIETLEFTTGPITQQIKSALATAGVTECAA